MNLNKCQKIELGTEVLVAHDGGIHDGRVVEGPTLAGQYRIVIVGARDWFGWLKTNEQFRVKPQAVVAPELEEIRGLQELINKGRP